MFQRTKKIVAIIAVVVLLSSLMISPGLAKPARSNNDAVKALANIERPYVPNEVLVKFRPGASKMQVSSVKSNLALKSKKKSSLVGTELMEIKNGASVESVLNTLQRNEAVEFAQPNYRYFAQSVPDDVYYSELWGLNSNFDGVDIDAPEAWQITDGSDQMVVAVIDTGVDISHPDLAGRIWVNPGEEGPKANNGIDDDDNGLIDDVNGWDFYNSDKSVFDPLEGDDEHGTHVAGTIAAAINNATGIVGVAPKVKIMPLKFLGPLGGDTFGAIMAIQYAAEMGAKVINASWGSTVFDMEEDIALVEAINIANKVFVAAAGNDGINTDLSGNEVTPAGLNSTKIISVAAVGNAGILSDFSNYGAATVEIAAPGAGIKSLKPTYPEVASAIFSGTGTYKAIHFGFGLEHIADDFSRAQILQKALTAIGATTDSHILVVDDDNSDDITTNYADYLTKYLDALSGYSNVSYTAAGDLTDGPTLDNMQGKTVVWFTGEAYGANIGTLDAPKIIPTLTEEDRQNLQDFLAGGGRLILTGDDLAFKSEDDPLFTSYLKEKFIGEDYWRGISLGTNGTEFAGIEALLSGDTYFKDAFIPLEGAQKIFSYPQSGSGNEYQTKNGTSMAAPHVSGVAALILSLNPTLTPEQVISIIKKTVTPLPSLLGKIVTGGMVNAYQAVLEASAPTGLVATKSDKKVTLTWNNSSNWDIVGYNVYNCNSFGSILGKIATVTEAAYTHLGLTNGEKYYYKINAFDALGNVSQFSSLVNATPGTSGGGGGGGGGVPATAVPSTPAPTVNQSTGPKDISEAADTKESIGSDGTKVITAEISTDRLEEILTANPATKEFSVTLEGAVGKKEISLSAAGFAKLAERDVKLTVKTEGVTLNIPIGGIKAAGADIKITLRELEPAKEKSISDAAWSQQELAKVGKIMEFTIEAAADGKITEVKSFGGKLVSGEFPVESNNLQGIKDSRKLGVYKYLEASGSWQYVPSKLIDGKVIFTTSTFSKYSVMVYNKTFQDIRVHWAKDDIELMAAKQVVQGVNKDQFAPDAKITRAQFAALLVRAMNLNQPGNLKGTFKDVTAKAWYYPYVEAASSAGIIKGTGDKQFLPDKQISREEMAVMMVRAMKLVGQEANLNQADQNQLLLKFKDQSKISAWAIQEVASAVKLGIFNGAKADSFVPAQAATRAESAVVIKRLMEKAGLI